MAIFTRRIGPGDGPEYRIDMDAEEALIVSLALRKLLTAYVIEEGLPVEALDNLTLLAELATI